MLLFSATTAGFYDDGIHAHIPADAVAISAECHADLLGAQSQGLVIAADADGYPIAAPRAQPNAQEAYAALRDRRDQLLRASDFTQLPDTPMSADKREAWRVYRQALRDLPQAVTDAVDCIWPTSPND